MSERTLGDMEQWWSARTGGDVCDRRWKDGNGITHSVVRRVIRDAAWYPSLRAMVTRCANDRVPDRSLAFSEINCMACVAATTSRAR